MTNTSHDRGMQAVARVREVRERDSRLGLLQARQTVRQREQHAEELRGALREAQDHATGTVEEFVVSRALLTSMAIAVRDAEQRCESARTVATEAESRWQADKARLRAIRQLLQKRALQRVEAVERAERREVDDIVGQLHARRSKDARSRALLAARAATRAAVINAGEARTAGAAGTTAAAPTTGRSGIERRGIPA